MKRSVFLDINFAVTLTFNSYDSFNSSHILQLEVCVTFDSTVKKKKLNVQNGSQLHCHATTYTHNVDLFLPRSHLEQIIKISLMYLLNPLNSVTEVFVITENGFEPATSYVREEDATAAPARHR